MALIIEESDLEKFIVVGDRVLIKPKSPQEKTKSGLYLPPGVQEKEKIHSGYVLKVGPGYPIPAIQDIDEPWKVLYRTNQYILTPEAPYEVTGKVPNVVFPCAALVDAPTGRIAVYYGGADTFTCVAFTRVNELIDFIKANSEVF